MCYFGGTINKHINIQSQGAGHKHDTLKGRLTQFISFDRSLKES